MRTASHHSLVTSLDWKCLRCKAFLPLCSVTTRWRNQLAERLWQKYGMIAKGARCAGNITWLATPEKCRIECAAVDLAFLMRPQISGDVLPQVGHGGSRHRSYTRTAHVGPFAPDAPNDANGAGLVFRLEARKKIQSAKLHDGQLAKVRATEGNNRGCESATSCQGGELFCPWC